ncbi:hypothetical protein ACIA5G_53605 [Amycolatopsis sp. NPDC051758]|uniref:hypothetical protein n=1 Tax=Amycolatopsis sp. NPDC051758 TaxID=3363935 RepID=UPI0037A6EB6D
MTRTGTAAPTGDPVLGDRAARRLRQAAARFWRAAAEHRTRAAELEQGEATDRRNLAQVQRDLGAVAAEHALACQELAVAQAARADAVRQRKHSPQWTDAVRRSCSAVRHADVHLQRAAAFAARAAGRGDEARWHRRAESPSP